MTDDRELLEAAAKALGWERMPVDEAGASWLDPVTSMRHWEDTWSPLTDDGDALRLVVRLCLTVKVEGHECEVFSNDGECLSSVPIMGASCFANAKEATNPYAATRRAIVRAAAALQETKQ